MNQISTTNLIFLIDFLNIANLEKRNKWYPSMVAYNRVWKKLKYDLFPEARIFAIADPHAPARIYETEEYEDCVRYGYIIQVPSGKEADEYILRYAKDRENCYIISNDKYEEYVFEDELRNRIITVYDIILLIKKHPYLFDLVN